MLYHVGEEKLYAVGRVMFDAVLRSQNCVRESPLLCNSIVSPGAKGEGKRVGRDGRSRVMGEMGKWVIFQHGMKRT